MALTSLDRASWVIAGHEAPEPSACLSDVNGHIRSRRVGDQLGGVSQKCGVPRVLRQRCRVVTVGECDRVDGSAACDALNIWLVILSGASGAVTGDSAV